TSALTLRLRQLAFTASTLSRMNCTSSIEESGVRDQGSDTQPVRGQETAAWGLVRIFSALTASRPLLQRPLRPVVLADIDLLGPVDAVALDLFQPVSQPASHASDGEDWHEQVARDPQRLVDDSREVIDVRIDALGSVDAGRHALQLQRNLVPLG